MTNIKLFLAFIFISITNIACQTTSTPIDDTSAIQQKYLFDVQHVNMAWGYRLNGIFIDSEGNIYSYQGPQMWQTENDAVEQSKSYTEEELEEKYQSAKLVGTVDFEELLEYYRLAETLDSNQLSDWKDAGCRDVGIYSFLVYEYTPSENTYTPVVIHTAGVVWQQNLSTNGPKIYEWLRKIIHGDTEQNDNPIDSCGFDTFN